MAAKLIVITPCAEDTSILIARVSSPNQTTLGGDKLLRYCLDKGHWSVFEHAYATIEIETSRAIGRQILRHRSFTFSEFSQRYAEVDVNDMVMNEARAQDTKNRQNSNDTLEAGTKIYFEIQQEQLWTKAVEEYKRALELGIAKECARVLLPEGLTPTRMYMTGSLRSWIHYINLRTGHGTQREHMAIAEECKQALIPVLPILSKATGWTE